jgi:splicing factor 3B subunit 1
MLSSDFRLRDCHPTSWLCTCRRSSKTSGALRTTIGGFEIKEGSDAVFMAAAAGLAPELPTEIPGVGNLAFFKPEDAQYFAKILKEEDETEPSIDEMKERKIMRLLLKIKNGTPPVRKTALRQITDKA